MSVAFFSWQARTASGYLGPQFIFLHAVARLPRLRMQSSPLAVSSPRLGLSLAKDALGH